MIQLLPISQRSEDRPDAESWNEDSQKSKDSQGFQPAHYSMPDIPTTPEQQSSSPSNPFVALLLQIKNEKSVILGWLGKQSYRSNIQKRSPMGKSLLGVMLDKKAE
jgi:hypothetical protein